MSTPTHTRASDEPISGSLIIGDPNAMPKMIVERQNPGKIYEVYFDEPIEDGFQYRELIQKMRTLTRYDELHLLIHCPGGDVNTAIQLHHELVECNARTVAHIYHAFSAGGVIALSCDEVKVTRKATFLAHNIAYGVQGKGGSTKSMVEFITRTANDLMYYIYEGFMTPDEITRMTKDEDFWMDEEELKKRLTGWIPVRRRLSQLDACGGIQ